MAKRRKVDNVDNVDIVDDVELIPTAECRKLLSEKLCWLFCRYLDFRTAAN